jgi:hypothetical protein
MTAGDEAREQLATARMTIRIALRTMTQLDMPESHLRALHMAEVSILEVESKTRKIEYDRLSNVRTYYARTVKSDGATHLLATNGELATLCGIDLPGSARSTPARASGTLVDCKLCGPMVTS